MKHTYLLAAGLFLAAIPMHVSADVIAEDVTRANIKQQPLVFDVRTEKRKAGVHFVFTVRETKELSRYHDAGIDIRDGIKPLVECFLKPFHKEKSVSYELTVSCVMLRRRFACSRLGLHCTHTPRPAYSRARRA